MQEPIKKNLRSLFNDQIKPVFEKWVKACFDAKVSELEDTYTIQLNGVTFEANLKFKEKNNGNNK